MIGNRAFHMSSQASADGHHGHEHHHHDGPIDWPLDPEMGKASPGKIAMWIFLLSDAFSFGGLLLGYGILRAHQQTWRHEGEPVLGINFTAGLTFLLICSSVTMVLAVAAAQENKRSQTVKYMLLTVLGGILFLCGQMQEYFGVFHFLPGMHDSHGLVKEGLTFGKTAYASTFYVITSFHGAHVTAGTIYNAIIALNAARGKYDNGNYNQVEIAGLFWHFVDLVWILVFTFVYLIPE